MSASQSFDARILDQGDECYLQRLQRPDRESWATEYEMRLGMRRCCPV
jgi:hypothetical protein